MGNESESSTHKDVSQASWKHVVTWILNKITSHWKRGVAVTEGELHAEPGIGNDALVF